MLKYRGPDNAPIGRSDLARALGFVALWRARPSNLATRKALTGTDSNGVSGVLTNKGPAYSLTGTGTGGISMPVPDSAPFTMLVMARSVTSGSSALGRVMSTFNGAGGNDWYYDGGSHQIQVFTASTNSTFTLPSSLLTGSTFQCVAISLSGVVGAQTPIAYADGVPVTVSTVAAGSGARVAGGTTLGVGYRPDTTGRQAGGVFVLAAYATRHLSARELAQVTARPDLLLAPRRIWVPVSAGGAADLTLADASHAHAADSLSLTTASTLTIADATHAHTAEALSLTTASTLAVADALHDHAAEGLALTTESLLALQDALHDHAADAPELLSGSSLLIAEALQAHTADGLALVVDAYLTVANAGHGHTADALVLTVPSTGADPAAVWSYVLSNGKTAEENVVEILAKLQALHDIHGLTLGSPLTVSATARAAGTISQTISSSSGTTTVTRTS